MEGLDQERQEQPQRIDVVGPLATLRFPNLCTRCGDPPAGALTITKMFRRVPSEAPAYHVFESVRAPFCARCLAEHERDLPPVDPRVIRKLRLTWLVRALPYVIPVVCITYLLKEFAVTLVRRMLRGADVVELVVFGAVVLFFGGMLAMFLRLILNGRKELIADHAGDPNGSYVEIVRAAPAMQCVIPGPPTRTKAAVDFTDEHSNLFEPDRRVVTIANPVVFEHFQGINADRVWDGQSPRARRASTARWVLAAAVVTAVAGYFLWTHLGP